jgi:hypothetical protein
MDFYTFVSIFVLPLTIIHFCIDYLRDRDITHSETKIGVYQFIHHFIVIFNLVGTLALPFFNIDFLTLFVSICILIIAQIGYLMNDEYCWLLIMTNKMINPEHPKRKWIADIDSFIKNYTRGDSWAYSDIYSIDNTIKVTICNCVFIFILIKYSLKL